jgi:hypothetical protein
MDERKATDILISIEEDIKKVLSYVQNLDLNSKIQTERTRLLEEKLNAVVSGLKSVPKPQPSSNVVVGSPDKQIPAFAAKSNPTRSPFLVAPDLKNRVEQALKEAKLDSKLEDEMFVERSPVGNKRTQPKPVNSQKQVVVQQKVIYESDAKSVYMGTVEIFSMKDDQLVKQTRTTQNGKWMAPLTPGEYTVKVSKAATPLKAEVKISFPISVEDSDNPIELPLKKV